MPLDRLILILVVVITAAAGTIWLASLVLINFDGSGWIGFALPVLLVGFVCWRMIHERMKRPEDDPNDTFEG